ncbi:hypothetical protein HDU97_002266 [Phlyctochytrium planicorne]|nr:hypothetical protein HDU97_002266 [Phlyctochytrium planicorne]
MSDGYMNIILAVVVVVKVTILVRICFIIRKRNRLAEEAKLRAAQDMELPEYSGPPPKYDESPSNNEDLEAGTGVGSSHDGPKETDTLKGKDREEGEEQEISQSASSSTPIDPITISIEGEKVKIAEPPRALSS